MRKVAIQEVKVSAVVPLLEAWFPIVFRRLPWRNKRTPWRVFVSEVMLQQTQASRVAEKFELFLQHFPTPKHLAESSQESVLAIWQGLGYYRRAKNLRFAAQMIVKDFGARVPDSLESLKMLPGIGRYSAGAIASIAFAHAAPIVDGNVVRVLSRLADRRELSKGKIAEQWMWSQAERMVKLAKSPAVFNEALMELGATICTPRSPNCAACPVSQHCVSHSVGSQDRVPMTVSAKPRRTVVHHAFVEIRNSKIALVTRPATGLWGGMLSPPVIESSRTLPISQLLKQRSEIKCIKKLLGHFQFLTTHRTIRVRVYETAFKPKSKVRWISVKKLSKYAVSNAVLQIAQVAQDSILKLRTR